MLFTGLLPMAGSVGFLMQIRTTLPELAPPTVDWTLWHQPLIKKMPHRLNHRQSNGGIFSIEVLSSQVTLV